MVLDEHGQVIHVICPRVLYDVGILRTLRPCDIGAEKLNPAMTTSRGGRQADVRSRPYSITDWFAFVGFDAFMRTSTIKPVMLQVWYQGVASLSRSIKVWSRLTRW